MSKVESIESVRGWKALDLDNPELGAIRANQAEYIKQINSDMRELFMDSELGQRVLETLKAWTIYRPACDPHATERIDMFKSGQDDIVRCILAAIKNSEIGDK